MRQEADQGVEPHPPQRDRVVCHRAGNATTPAVARPAPRAPPRATRAPPRPLRGPSARRPRCRSRRRPRGGRPPPPAPRSRCRSRRRSGARVTARSDATWAPSVAESPARLAGDAEPRDQVEEPLAALGDGALAAGRGGGRHEPHERQARRAQGRARPRRRRPPAGRSRAVPPRPPPRVGARTARAPRASTGIQVREDHDGQARLRAGRAARASRGERHAARQRGVRARLDRGAVGHRIAPRHAQLDDVGAGRRRARGGTPWSRRDRDTRP